MIVVPVESGLRVVTQHDHAVLAAEILSLWRADGLPDHPRRAALLLATREHDNGWREIDAAPPVDRATGRPHDFRTLPAPERARLWRRGVERYADDPDVDRHVARLVAAHAVALHRDLASDPSIGELLGRCEEILGEERETAVADHVWLGLADRLSLVALGVWPEARTGRWLARLVGTRLELDPYPLAGATTFRVASRRIPDRRYRSDLDLATELVAARFEPHRVTIAPQEP